MLWRTHHGGVIERRAGVAALPRLLESPPGVLLCSELVRRDGGGLAFVPALHHEHPEETRRSVERLLDRRLSSLCLDHGAPVSDDPRAALRQLLASTA